MFRCVDSHTVLIVNNLLFLDFQGVEVAALVLVNLSLMMMMLIDDVSLGAAITQPSGAIQRTTKTSPPCQTLPRELLWRKFDGSSLSKKQRKLGNTSVGDIDGKTGLIDQDDSNFSPLLTSDDNDERSITADRSQLNVERNRSDEKDLTRPNRMLKSMQQYLRRRSHGRRNPLPPSTTTDGDAETPAETVSGTVGLSSSEFLLQRGRHPRSELFSAAASIKHQQCQLETYWKKMPEGTFPPYLETGRCRQTTCMFGLYECRPHRYTVTVLQRMPRRCSSSLLQHLTPTSGPNGTASVANSGVVREERLWRFVEYSVIVGCDCSVRRNEGTFTATLRQRAADSRNLDSRR